MRGHYGFVSALTNGRHAMARRNMAFVLREAIDDLKLLQEEGILTDDEFKAEKDRIVGLWRKRHEEGVRESAREEGRSEGRGRRLEVVQEEVEVEPVPQVTTVRPVRRGFGAQLDAPVEGQRVAKHPLYENAPFHLVHAGMHRLLGGQMGLYAAAELAKAKRDQESLYPGMVFKYHGLGDAEKVRDFYKAVVAAAKKAKVPCDVLKPEFDRRTGKRTGFFVFAFPTEEEAKKALEDAGRRVTPAAISRMREDMVDQMISPDLIQVALSVFESMKVPPSVALSNRGRSRFYGAW